MIRDILKIDKFKTSNIWISSDLHLEDKKIERIRKTKTDFIFQNHLSIPEEDILIFLGDICLENSNVEEIHKKYIKRMPYKKILIRGNHDKKTNLFYLNNGWDYCINGTFILKTPQKIIILSHRPKFLKNKELLKYHYQIINIHGHFHSGNPLVSEPQIISFVNENCYLFALEYNNFSPRRLDEILELIKQNKFKHTFERINEIIREAKDPNFFKKLVKINTNKIKEKYLNYFFHTKDYEKYLADRGYRYNKETNLIEVLNKKRSEDFYLNGL